MNSIRAIIIITLIATMFTAVLIQAENGLANSQPVLIGGAEKPFVYEQLNTAIYYETENKEPPKEKVDKKVLKHQQVNIKQQSDNKKKHDDERDYKYLKVWRPTSIEPYKSMVWNAHTLEKNTLIIRTRLLYRWASGRYDGEGDYHSYYDSETTRRFVEHLYAYYGLTNRLELGLHSGYATITRKVSQTAKTEITHTGFIDSSISARYMFLYDPERIYLTAGAGITFPVGVDEFIGDDYRYNTGLMLTMPFKPINIYADVHYTFRTPDDKFNYDDIIRAKLGIEYFARGNDISIIFAVGGVWWGYGDTKSSEISIDKRGFRKLSFSPAVTYKPKDSSMTFMAGFTHNFMGKDHQRFTRVFFDFQIGFGGIFSRNK